MSLTPEERREHKRQVYKRWAAKNREKLAASKRRYYANNKERFRKRNAEAQQRYRQTHPGHRRWRDGVRERKAGRPRPAHCEVCGGNKGGIAFDHCHQRGLFRGWLCNACNSILGYAQDDPNRLRMLIAYLERTAKLIPPQLVLPGV